MAKQEDNTAKNLFERERDEGIAYAISQGHHLPFGEDSYHRPSWDELDEASREWWRSKVRK